MDNKVMLKTGIIGSAIAALCCFTPLLVWILSGFGVAALAVWVDPVALTMLVVFLALTGYALWNRSPTK
jgi:mercuric ion transport protein